jgi:hypothetical protein
MKIKLKTLLAEAKVHEYGCVMLYFDFPEINKIHSLINSNDIYVDPSDDSYGLEDEPHCTLLYGLHDGVSVRDILGSLKNITFSECKIHTPSLFENEKYDVLKFEVTGIGLTNANKRLIEFPHTTDYPEYHPHLTISYLNRGVGKRYVDILIKKGLTEFMLTPSYGVYSQTNGNKLKFKINKNGK